MATEFQNWTSLHFYVNFISSAFQNPPVEIIKAVITYVRSLKSVDDLDALGQEIFKYVSFEHCKLFELRNLYSSTRHFAEKEIVDTVNNI